MSLLKQKEEDDRGTAHREMDPRNFPARVLSDDLAADRGAGIDFGGDHAGSERGAPLAAESSGHSGRCNWLITDRGECFLCYGFADRLARLLGARA